jgi:hypothetical protein
MANYLNKRQAMEHAPMVRELCTQNSLNGRAVAAWREEVVSDGERLPALRLTVLYAREAGVFGTIAPPTEVFMFPAGEVRALEGGS